MIYDKVKAYSFSKKTNTSTGCLKIGQHRIYFFIIFIHKLAGTPLEASIDTWGVKEGKVDPSLKI